MKGIKRIHLNGIVIKIKIFYLFTGGNPNTYSGIARGQICGVSSYPPIIT